MWEINGDYPEARLTVGSDQQAGWCVEAPGVKPVHCELFWDGTALWVSDTARVGGIFLDGARVTEWVQIQGPAELRFGQAAMDVETSAPSAQRMLSKPGNARPVTVTDMVAAIGERPSRPLFGGAAGDESVPDLEAEKTRMQPAPSLDEVRTSIAIPNVPERPAPANDLRPRLGGANPSPASAHSADATRMVPMPVRPPASDLSPLGFGTPRAAPPSIGNPIGVPIHPSTSLPSLGAPVGAGPPAAAPPRPPPPPPPPPPPSHSGIPLDQGEFQHPGGFAAPPPPAESAEANANVLGKVWDVVKPEQPKTEGKQALPTRTWILLGVTVLVTVGWLLWDDAPEEAAPQAQTATVVTPPPTTPEPTTPPGEDAVDPAAATDTQVAGDAVEPNEPAPEPPVVTPPAPADARVSNGEPEDEDGPTLARRASDAYVTGQYEAALELYRSLAQGAPDDDSFATMVNILERRIAEQSE